MACPKKSYPDEASARNALRKIRKNKPWRTECVYYHCHCNNYHLSSKTWSPAAGSTKFYNERKV